ncbi:YdcF family protein [Falsiroseomonas selenitidurans]|uniref:YdcF family protein n=1 Tax=Falsiroseomonas selenitidurans TaxID=2716335 RepID=A0ABX1DY59_9PROT|nr:YdcF family protein [Falsiroseomonas selenitidurans]NKC29852.1 YdcF family protein [Falsiroseomonas selenitidurans]
MPGLTTRDAIAQFLFVRDEPGSVDLAMVLGAPTPSAMEPAIALYRQGLTRRILITGHGPATAARPEWAVFRDLALAAGVPESALLIEPEARNTRENFLLSEALIAREIGWEQVTAIAIASKPFHARRALMTARRIFPPHLRLAMTPPRHPADLQAETWWHTQAGRARIYGEIRRIADYALQDHLSDD